MQKRHKRTIVYIAGFLYSLPIAFTSYINSSFLENFISAKFVGILYTIASIITMIALVKMPKLMQLLGNRKVAMWLSATLTATLLTMGISNGNLTILAFVLSFIVSNLLITSLDIFVEEYSNTKNTGKVRGAYLALMSLAWVVAQLISGSIINKSSFSGIYIFSSLFMLLTTFIFAFFLHDFKDPIYKKFALVKTLRTFAKSPNLRKAYLINLVLKFFFVWMIVYTPIYLHENIGFNWGQIGIIFSIMLMPFVLVTFPLGELSDKIGEKQMLIYGFLIMATSTAIIPFITLPQVYIWAAILFATRLGAATVEIMNESYFFKLVHEENVDEVAFFRSTQPISYLTAPLLATLVLFFTPSFEYIFFVLAAVILFGLFITLRLRDVK